MSYFVDNVEQNIMYHNNKWMNQRIKKKYNNKVQHNVDQRKSGKKLKIQKLRKIIQQEMTFYFDDLIEDEYDEYICDDTDYFGDYSRDYSDEDEYELLMALMYPNPDDYCGCSSYDDCDLYSECCSYDEYHSGAYYSHDEYHSDCTYVDEYCIIEDESDTFNCVPIRQKYKHLSQKISKKYKNKHRRNHAYHPKSTIHRQSKKCNKKWCKQCQVKGSKYGTKRESRKLKRKHLRACRCNYPNKNMNKKEIRNKYDYQELYDAFTDIEMEDDYDIENLEEIAGNSCNEDKVETVSQHHQLKKIDGIDFVPCHLFVNDDGSGYIKFDDLDSAYQRYWNKTINLSASVIKNYWRQWMYKKYRISYECFIRKTSTNNTSFRNLMDIMPLNKSYYLLFRKTTVFMPGDIKPCVGDVKRHEMQIILSGYVRTKCGNDWNKYMPQDIAYIVWKYCF